VSPTPEPPDWLLPSWDAQPDDPDDAARRPPTPAGTFGLRVRTVTEVSRAIRERVRALADAEVAVIVSDTFGRPWRHALTNVAIGVAGIRPIRNYIGQTDPHGMSLRVTELAVADELAAAAELVMGKLDRVPVATVRGAIYERGEGSAAELIRPADRDLFR